MTNYNERLDEILQNLSWKQHKLGTKGLIPLSRHGYDTKQAITSLIKELVAEAKPAVLDSFYEKPIVDEFEQNLLKALEEV